MLPLVTVTYCGFGRPNYAILSSSTFLTFHMFSTDREWDNTWIGFDLYYTAFHEDGTPIISHSIVYCVVKKKTCGSHN